MITAERELSAAQSADGMVSLGSRTLSAAAGAPTQASTMDQIGFMVNF